jgi:hypothetical protein
LARWSLSSDSLKKRLRKFHLQKRNSKFLFSSHI